MSDQSKKTGRAAIEEIDLRLDGLLGKLGGTLGELLDALDRGETGELQRTHDFQTTRGPVRAETGIRIRMGLGDEAAARPRPFRGASTGTGPSPTAQRSAPGPKAAAPRTPPAEAHSRD